MSGPRIMATASGLIIALTAVHMAPLHAQGQISQLSQDSKIIFQMASSNLLEIRLGQLAQQKASNAAVKQFGQQMVTDHTNMENQLSALVSKNGTKFQPGMGKANEEEVARLEKLSGAEFDRSYMTSMIQHHQQDVAAFQSASQTARSSEARQMVASGLPILQQHLTMATQVGGQVGASGGVAVATQPAQNPSTSTQPTPNPPVATTQPGQVSTQAQGDIAADMPFLQEAVSANLMEIRLGQLAQSRATNQSVKQFGQRMVTDHTNMQNQLTAAVSGSGQTLTPSMTPEDENQLLRLQRLAGADFDRAYMNLMIQAHQEDLRNFQTQSRSARSAQVRTLAANSLPVLQQHVSLAMQVGGQVGADSTGNGVGGVGGNDGNRGNVRADAEFIRDVGADNLMQIQLAQLARDRAKNNEVRQFAQEVIGFHTRLQNQWSAMASRNGMTYKPGMGPRHREKIEQLQKAKGKNFDKAYMTLMVQQHQDEVSYWQKEGRASRSAEVRRLVNNGLPTLEQHLTQAKQIARQVGVNPDEALRNRQDIDRDKNNDKNKKD